MAAFFPIPLRRRPEAAAIAHFFVDDLPGIWIVSVHYCLTAVRAGPPRGCAWTCLGIPSNLGAPMRATCVRGIRIRPRLFLPSLLTLGALIAGCGGPNVGVNLNTIAQISAPTNTVRVTQTVQLSAFYLGSGQAMVFSVNGIPGGNSTVGTISSTGLYTAPAVVPTNNTVQITS